MARGPNGLQRTQRRNSRQHRADATRLGSAAGRAGNVRRFNARLSAKGSAWFWPKIAAAITSKHHWLVIACDSCGTMVDLDLRVKPRDPEASVRVALRGVRCPRCNGHGRPRIIALSRHPSI
jgi:ribosomal protein L44E